VLRFHLRNSSIPFLLAAGLASCVPSQPTDSAPDAGPKATKKAESKPAPAASARRASEPPKARPGPVIAAPFEDRFDRTEIGSDWHRLGDAWSLKDGKLCVRNARNKGIWLRRRLPVNARIEFEATSESPDGDIKAELWGDGASGATAASYTNATSYLTIFGGWKNSFHVLARIDEHAKNRLEVRTDPTSSVEREKPVSAGRVYAFRVERSDGKAVSWWVDGHLIHRLEDPEPLSGEGHEHFGFNNWEVPVCFDNLTITPL
jgi:hypothetical protein